MSSDVQGFLFGWLCLRWSILCGCSLPCRNSTAFCTSGCQVTCEDFFLVDRVWGGRFCVAVLYAVGTVLHSAQVDVKWRARNSFWIFAHIFCCFSSSSCLSPPWWQTPLLFTIHPQGKPLVSTCKCFNLEVIDVVWCFLVGSAQCGLATRAHRKHPFQRFFVFSLLSWCIRNFSQDQIIDCQCAAVPIPMETFYYIVNFHFL